MKVKTWRAEAPQLLPLSVNMALLFLNFRLAA
jgi:hypothetical protein